MDFDSSHFWEISDMMVNKYEEDLDFTKDGIVDLFKQLNTETKFKVLKEDKKTFKLSCSNQGTFLESKLPCYKTEYVFDKTVSFKKIAKAMVNNREMWDESI